MIQALTIDQLHVGQKHQRTMLMTEQMMADYARAVGDRHSLHHDPITARESYFGGLVSPGMLTAGLIGLVLGTEFPGLGTVYVSQDLKFLKPVRAGDQLTINLQISEIIPSQNRVRLNTTIDNQHGHPVLSGNATVMPPGEGR